MERLNHSQQQMSDIRGDKMAMIFQEPMTSLNPAYSIGNQLMEAMLRHKKISMLEIELWNFCRTHTMLKIVVSIPSSTVY